MNLVIVKNGAIFCHQVLHYGISIKIFHKSVSFFSEGSRRKYYGKAIVA